MDEPPKNSRMEKRPGDSRVGEQQLLAIERGLKRNDVLRTEPSFTCFCGEGVQTKGFPDK